MKPTFEKSISNDTVIYSTKIETKNFNDKEFANLKSVAPGSRKYIFHSRKDAYMATGPVDRWVELFLKHNTLIVIVKYCGEANISKGLEYIDEDYNNLMGQYSALLNAFDF